MHEEGIRTVDEFLWMDGGQWLSVHWQWQLLVGWQVGHLCQTSLWFSSGSSGGTKLRGNRISHYIRDNVDRNVWFKTPTGVRSHKLYKQPYRLNIFSQQIIDDWNKLPADFVDSCSLNTFKNRLTWYMRYNGKFYKLGFYPHLSYIGPLFRLSVCSFCRFHVAS